MFSYKLTYFDAQGKGEPIRLMLSYLGEKFEDCRINYNDWPSKKSGVGAPFGRLPLLEINGKIIHQTLAIVRYLGKQANLCGKNDWEALQINMAADTIEDLISAFSAWYREEDEELKANKKKILFNETAPFYLSKLDEQIKNNNGYLDNGRLSWADIFLFGVSTFIGKSLEINIFEQYPNIKIMRDNILANRNIKEWVDKRPLTEY